MEAKKPIRTLVRAVGLERFDDTKVKAIKSACADARDLTEFFVKQAKNAQTGPPLEDRLIDRSFLVTDSEAGASGKDLQAFFDDIEQLARSNQIERGPKTFIFLETHHLHFQEHSRFLARDAVAGSEKGTIDADKVAGLLGWLAGESDPKRGPGLGCTVVVFLDCVHDRKNDASINEWARELNKRNVIAIAASKQGEESYRLSGHGAFAEAIRGGRRRRLLLEVWGQMGLHTL